MDAAAHRSRFDGAPGLVGFGRAHRALMPDLAGPCSPWASGVTAFERRCAGSEVGPHWPVQYDFTAGMEEKVSVTQTGGRNR